MIIYIPFFECRMSGPYSGFMDCCQFSRIRILYGSFDYDVVLYLWEMWRDVWPGILKIIKKAKKTRKICFSAKYSFYLQNKIIN